MISWLVPVERYESELEVGAPLLAWIESIVEQRAVNSNLLGFGVDTEWIARPQNDVRILTRFESTNLVVQTKRPGGIYREPLDRLIFAHRQPDLGARFHRLCGFLVQPLRPGRIVRVNDYPRTGIVD